MARKSRREKNNPSVEVIPSIPAVVAKNENLLSTGAYGRLSSEKKTDDSLETQMALLYSFISNHPDLKLTDSYIDNGYTGTNFERPEFVRLMDDVRSGRINCIVVKDLSRFGRDYIEAGYYIETLFPHLNVRFIAVTDNFDSFREGDIDSLSAPLKNMVNAMYAKDISKKMSTAAKIRAKREGAMPNGTAPYGYRFSEGKKEYLEDQSTVPYVRMIFYWAAHGVEVHEIAERLTLIGAITPGQSRNGSPNSEKQQREWRTDMVYKILKHPVYTGDVYLRRMEQALYKSQSRRRTAPEEQTVRGNTHFPCVTREDFQLIQERMLNNKKNSMKKHQKNIEERERLQDSLKGMVFCAECGRRMYYVRGIHDWTKGEDGKEKIAGYYRCGRGDEGNKGCGQIVYEDFLQIVAIDQIHFLIESTLDQERLLNTLKVANSDKHPLISIEKRLAFQKRKIAEEEERAEQLYMNYADGIIPVEDYMSLKERFAEEAEKQKEELKALEERRITIEGVLTKHSEMIRHLSGYAQISSFDQSLTHEIIERFIVSTSGNIEVRFNSADVLKQTLMMLEAKGEDDGNS